MNLTRQSIEILLDLLEIKVGALQVHDRDDARELNKLRKCRQELLSEQGQLNLKHSSGMIGRATYQERSYRKVSY